MRILVVGAGAVGGYFGGRLLEKGEDVTFLVRDRRKQELEEHGLQIESVHGNASLRPSLLTKEDPAQTFDLIILSNKAYHLHSVVQDIAPFVGSQSVILPLLNGMEHMNTLIDRFGDERVLGGLCFVESTLGKQGEIIQTSPIHDLVFGERNGEHTERIRSIEDVFSGTKANFRLSNQIEQEMWHKYLFISTLSGVTSLFRSPIGPIREDEDGLHFIEGVLHTTAEIMRGLQAPIKDDIEIGMKDKIHQMGYEMKSSMQRDMEKGQSVEASHFYGYLLQAARDQEIEAPLLSVIYANLKMYEKQL